ncbi:ATP-binding cassette domain-containing protein [uncultured Agathobaculum sp.]|uniref:energy-coupling factor ABC transporter ATP-binding protein n=1 Tax=uncultured Agathobaculum sp. TaxID=2048140 RepID=UPI0032096AD6
MQPILQVRDLRFCYDSGAPALDGVSLDVHAGERIAVLGPNGAGKSTFFLCLNGVLTPESGQILLDGKPVDRKMRKALCERVGIVFQNADDQIIASTVAAEVSFGPMNLRLPRDEVARRVDHALDYMDLQEFRARPPHDLSGGEKKRVSIADILAMESEVILLDEPAASLDPAGEERLERVLDRLSDEGRTLLISTHDVDFAFRWATRAVVFSAGRILADDTPQAVFGDAALLRQAHLRRPVLAEVFAALRARGLVPPDASCPASVVALERLLGEK